MERRRCDMAKNGINLQGTEPISRAHYPNIHDVPPDDITYDPADQIKATPHEFDGLILIRPPQPFYRSDGFAIGVACLGGIVALLAIYGIFKRGLPASAKYAGSLVKSFKDGMKE